MPELFQRTEVDFGGAFTADRGLIVPNKGLTGILMQNLNLQYGQAVSRIYEIGQNGLKPHVYYIGGRAQGTISAAHVIGPGLSMKLFYQNFSDVCQAMTNDLKLELGSNACPPGTSAGQAFAQLSANDPSFVGPPAAGSNLSYLAKYCVLVNIGFSVAAQDFVINESSQLMFSGLQVE